MTPIKEPLTTEAADGALRGALGECRDQFAFYTREHLAAGKTEKAETNQRFVNLCDAALHTPLPPARTALADCGDALSPAAVGGER